MLVVRFRDFPEDIAREWLLELISKALNVNTIVESDPNKYVDLEITGPYGGDSDDYKTSFQKRIARLGYITFTKGHHLSKRNLATGKQPLKTANKNIWFTGENVRPPQGNWDGYLSFDNKMSSDRSVYLPLWMMSSTNLFNATKKTLWNQNVPRVEDLLKTRPFDKKKRKFCCTFIGKAYSMRLHGLEVLSNIENVDVFGTSVRNTQNFPGKIAKNYNFCLCFENDIYPGYVTEKPFEAYIAQTIPLYFGHDNLGYLNPKAVINLFDFENIDSWAQYIRRVNTDRDLYKYHYEQPILAREPTLNDAINLIKKILVKD